MIAVDTNIISYLFLPGTHTDLAREAFRKDSEWCVPLLWRSEFRNVLMLYLQKGSLGLDTAVALTTEAEELMHGREYQVASGDILDLVNSSTCSAYDCEFIALARELGTRLLTSDKQLLKAFPDDTVLLKAFVGNQF